MSYEAGGAREIEDQHGTSPTEIAIGVVIGRSSEFFDFFVYAIASVLVFPKLDFPFVDALTGTLYSFGIFALAFVARPIGTMIFMAIDRAHGRGVKLTIALLMLGSSTEVSARPASMKPVNWRSAASRRPCTACSRTARARLPARSRSHACLTKVPPRSKARATFAIKRRPSTHAARPCAVQGRGR